MGAVLTKRDTNQAMLDDWDSTVFKKFREEFELSKSDMIRLLQAQGLEELNWATYNRWEDGVPDGRRRRMVVPRPVYRDTILRALAAIRHQLQTKRKERRTS